MVRAMLPRNRDRIGRYLRYLTLVAGLALLQPRVAAAAEPPQHVDVSVDERGFSPPNVIVGLGGTVTWTNTGTTSHNVSTGSAPIFIELGVDVGKSASWTFSLPGVYHYTATTDCSPSVSKALFPCSDY